MGTGLKVRGERSGITHLRGGEGMESKLKRLRNSRLNASPRTGFVGQKESFLLGNL